MKILLIIIAYLLVVDSYIRLYRNTLVIIIYYIFISILMVHFSKRKALTLLKRWKI